MGFIMCQGIDLSESRRCGIRYSLDIAGELSKNNLGVAW